MSGSVWAPGDGDDGGVLDHQDASEFSSRSFSSIEDLGVMLLLKIVSRLVGEVLQRDVGQRKH